MVQALDALIEVRKDCGILDENSFLFPNSSLGHLSSWDTLTSLAKDAGCINPMAITSLRLRKYLATIFQVCTFYKIYQKENSTAFAFVNIPSS